MGTIEIQITSLYWMPSQHEKVRAPQRIGKVQQQISSMSSEKDYYYYNKSMDSV